jgi:uncharacterized damage-inducible protein DinB
MAAKKNAPPFVLADALLHAYAINNRITIYLIENLPDAAWRADPPGGKGRQVAAITSHMHNVRRMWLKATGAKKIPQELDRATVTKKEAISALKESWMALEDVLQQSIASDGRVKGFKPDAAGFLGYLISHDAHHRGQISMLARQAGYPISQGAMFGMWEWGKR